MASIKLFSGLTRSELMARIRSTGNKATELRLATVFRAQGITGWRRHRALVLVPAGRVRPDFVFPRLRVAVFVDGCFWHGCPRHGTQPKQNARFWREKIAVNQTRDRLVNRGLRRAGWRVLRIWEHELSKKNEVRLLMRLERLTDGE